MDDAREYQEQQVAECRSISCIWILFKGLQRLLRHMFQLEHNHKNVDTIEERNEHKDHTKAHCVLIARFTWRQSGHNVRIRTATTKPNWTQHKHNAIQELARTKKWNGSKPLHMLQPYDSIPNPVVQCPVKRVNPFPKITEVVKHACSISLDIRCSQVSPWPLIDQTFR